MAECQNCHREVKYAGDHLVYGEGTRYSCTQAFKGVDGTTFVPFVNVREAVVEENILQEADRLTSSARPDDYGHPKDNLQQTADLWSPILGVKVTARQVALCMIQLKISRECFKPGRDNLTDIAGWARTIERLSE